MRRTLRRSAALLVLAGALCGASWPPRGMREAEAYADRYLRLHAGSEGFVSTPSRLIHYVAGGTKGRPKVIFVHGSPGSWKAFAHFLDDPVLSATAFIILPDRPGYGDSGAGLAETSVEAQARELSALLALDDPAQPAVIVGHSYGGAVVARMAMSGDPRIRAVVLVAASVDPDLERKKWYQYLADVSWLRSLIPQDLDVCNKEIEALKPELARMLPDWPEIRARVTVIQGLEDDLVPPGNAEFIRRHAVERRPAITLIPGQDHFVPWERPDLIRQAVMEELAPERLARR